MESEDEADVLRLQLRKARKAHLERELDLVFIFLDVSRLEYGMGHAARGARSFAQALQSLAGARVDLTYLSPGPEREAWEIRIDEAEEVIHSFEPECSAAEPECDSD